MSDERAVRLALEAGRLRIALQNIANVLGPDRVCNCDHTCGLPEEASEALRLANEALAGGTS